MSTVHLLFGQDPAMRVLPRGVITSLLVGLLFRTEPDLAHGLSELDLQHLPGGFEPMYLVTVFLVLTFVFSANTWTRASRVSVGLPVSTRTTWLVRTASLISVAVATIFTMALVLGVSITTEGAAVNPVIALAALRATVTAVLLILVYQLPLADRDRIPITAEYVIYVIFISIIVIPFSAAGITSVAGSIFFLVVAVGLGGWLNVRTPSTWSVGPSVEESDYPVWSSDAPREAEGRGAGWDVEASPANSPARPSVHWTLFRTLTNFLPKWLILVGIAGACTVVVLEFFDGTNAFLPLILVTVWHLPILQISLERMTPFDPLPISRHTLWAYTLGPAVVAIVIGFLVAQAFHRASPTSWSQIHIQDCCITVPWEYLEIASDGVPPTVTSPWGESITPTADPLWRGRRPALYDPYEVTAESSPRFVDYQIRRAAEAVYGSTQAPEPSRSDSQAASTAAGNVDRETLLLDLTRGRVAEGRNRSAAIVLLLFTLMVIVLMIPALMQYGSSVHRKLFRWSLWGTLILFGVIAVAVAAARLGGYIEIWYVGAVISIGIRHLAGWIPVPTGILWVLFVTFWFGAYLLLEKVFSRIELPGRSIVNRFAEEY